MSVRLFSVVALLAVFFAVANLPEADQISLSMKQILNARANDFATIRTSPHSVSGETQYLSSVKLRGAHDCYITPAEQAWYSNECDIAESKDRAAVMAQYAQYVKAMRGSVPASWTTWTQKTTKPIGEDTYFGSDRSHPAAKITWYVEGMNADFYDLTVTFFADGYTLQQ